MEGDGYTNVLHCETLDVIGEGYEPDANPVYCEMLEEAERGITCGARVWVETDAQVEVI
jgi:hypothetical protein